MRYYRHGKSVVQQDGVVGVPIATVLALLPAVIALYCLIIQWNSITRGQLLLGTSVEHSPDLLSIELPEVRSVNTVYSNRDDYRANIEAWEGPEPEVSLPKIVFCVTTADRPEQIMQWMRYHRGLGVEHFYLFVEGQAALSESMNRLSALQGVKIFDQSPRLLQFRNNSRAWKEGWLSSYFHKPCNSELFIKQSLNMEIAILQAQQDGMAWIAHIDTDELIYPAGSPSFSLQQLLQAVPSQYDSVVLPNYEALPEHGDVKMPFLEVTLFKKNYAHVNSDLYHKHSVTMKHGNTNYFLTYGNGKSVARVVSHLRSHGAHRFSNYRARPKEMTHPQAAVLHFTYNRFDDLLNRRDRCDCTPTQDDVKRCFFLAFDQAAFIESSLRSEEQLRKFFRERVVWDNPDTTGQMLKARLYEPMLLIQGYGSGPPFGMPLADASEDKLTVVDTLPESATSASDPT